MLLQQDNFNKLVTLVILIFTMVMIIWSFIVQQPLDAAAFLAFLPVTVVHSAHLLSNKLPDRDGNNGVGQEKASNQ